MNPATLVPTLAPNLVRKVHPRLTPYTLGIADFSIDELKTLLHK